MIERRVWPVQVLLMNDNHENGMIDYYETKSQPITRVMVIEAYRKVKSNKGSGGIDGMQWEDLEKDRTHLLYKLWNRLSSGSYFPPPVKEVEIAKKDGGIRKLGIPTLLDRIAQEVVKSHLERIVEPQFHDSSYGYRPGRSCHDAVEKVLDNANYHDWVIDLDIRQFFDTIDHKLLMKAVRHYCKDKWVLMYVTRWLNAGILNKDGVFIDRTSGTPQGGVISPLLANIFLHVVFDKWMEHNHPEKPFVRYADDIVVHCRTEQQARFVIAKIRKRLADCKLSVHTEKTRLVNLHGITGRSYPRSFDFLGFTIKPNWTMTSKGYHQLWIASFISQKSLSKVMDQLRSFNLHKRRKSIEEIARLLNPFLRGVCGYYCKIWYGHMYRFWMALNQRLLKWLHWEKGLYMKAGIRYLQVKYKENPKLFYHWKWVHP